METKTVKVFTGEGLLFTRYKKVLVFPGKRLCSRFWAIYNISFAATMYIKYQDEESSSKWYTITPTRYLYR